MYNDAMLEVSKSRQADIQREVEQARRGMGYDGATVRAERALPNWVNQLLQRPVFRKAKRNNSQQHVN